tara:strand:- start:1306 stop:2238 length:933 start_codon:yes stop_codon:yes gene_type:complete
MQKLVSVIMNCYNGEKYLKESLESVKNQNYKNWELIFYDNSSIDSSKDIFFNYQEKDKRFKYFKSKKKEKLGLARLNAFKKAKGAFFLFLDCDDYILPNKITVQIKLFKIKLVGAVYGNSIFFSKFFQRKLYKKDHIKKDSNIFYSLIENYNISLDTVIFKTRAVKKLSQGLDPKFNLIHDLDLIIRMSKVFKIRYCAEVLSHWRAHHSSTSNNAYLRFVKEKKFFEKKITNLYSKDIKLTKSLHHFREKYYVEECIGYLLERNNPKAIKILQKIKRKKIKFLLSIFCNIPFGNFFIKYLVYINKTILLK